MLREVFFIGIPASLTNLTQSLAALLTNRCLVAYGTDKVAAYGIATKVNMVCMLVLVGFAFGAQPALGYCYGAGNQKRLKEFLRFDFLVQVVIAAVYVLVTFALTRTILGVFLQDPQVIDAGILILRALMVSAPAVGLVLVMTTLFQAEGRALPAMILSISRQGVVLVICLYGLRALVGYNGILFAQAASDVITLCIALILLRCGRNTDASRLSE